MPRGTDLYDEARLQGRLWTPDILRANGKLRAWFDASALGTISVATGVSAWRDRRGLFDSAQGTGSAQPAYSGDSWRPGTRSMPALTPAVDILLHNDIGYTGGGGLSVQVASLNSGAAAIRGIVSGDTNASPVVDIDASQKVLLISSNIAVLLTSTAAVPTGHNVWGADFATNLTRAWINGASEENSTNPNFGAGLRWIFAQRGNVNFYDAATGEIVICLLLSNFEVLALQGYLAWKWGTVERLVYSHPYKRQPPLIGG